MRDGWEGVVGHEGTGHLTGSDERLLNLCAADGLKVGGSLFYHKNTHTSGLGA